jgi:rod shape-determining protein MreB
MDKETVYVGMDLGTFKTSVASSTGVREVLPSAVGWPKDRVARLALGRDVVFGKDVIEQRMALDVVRPFAKGVLKYGAPGAGLTREQVDKHQQAARLLVGQALELTRPPAGARVCGVIGVPARASVLNKKVVLEAAAGAFDAAMVVSEPFAIAYGMNRLTDTLIIDIGAGTTDLCPVWGTFPREEDQVTVPVGGDYIDEYFCDALRALRPEARMSLNMAREVKEKYGFVHDADEKAVVTLPVEGRPRPFDVTGPLRDACRTIVPPLLDGLRELVARFDPEFQQRLLQNVVLGGGGSQLRGLDRVIEEALQEYGGGRVTKVGDAVYAGAAGALRLAMSMPPDCWEELEATEAVPLAAPRKAAAPPAPSRRG